MLQLTFPAHEFFNEKTSEIVKTKEQTITLEHSLVSISKWESHWKKPFMSTETKSWPQCIDYIRCMTITQNVDPKIYLLVTNDMMQKVNAYVEDKMTATWINEKQRPPSRRIVTSELIYAWMFQLNIPMECQKWHLNRLLTLIRVCDIENNGHESKKLNSKDLAKRNSALNAARRAKHNTKG